LTAEKLMEGGVATTGSVTFTTTPFRVDPAISAVVLTDEANSLLSYTVHVRTRSTTGFTYGVRLQDEYQGGKFHNYDVTTLRTILWIAIEP
jgi:hypothetical protein